MAFAQIAEQLLILSLCDFIQHPCINTSENASILFQFYALEVFFWLDEVFTNNLQD